MRVHYLKEIVPIALGKYFEPRLVRGLRVKVTAFMRHRQDKLRRKLVLAIADGLMKLDDMPIYECKDLRVALTTATETA